MKAWIVLWLAAVLALANPARARSQTETERKIDSLEKVIETTDEDTTKALSLCRLCAELRKAGQMEAALENGEAGLKLARAAGDQKGEAECLKNTDVYVYYNARDVVSGDFYWTHRIDEHSALYSAADCTGHGVPGAFMSVLGATTLDAIVREYGETSPDKMLKLLDLSIRNALKQDENADGSLDGMDLALIKLDKKNRKLFFSSAGRPLFLLRNGEVLEYKGAKFPAGGAQHGEKEFPLIEIDLQPGDRIFMCSDGITDQFGGERGRKFSPKRLKETLLAHQDKDLQSQGAAFAAVFDDWQKSAKQLDDQLLIGLDV